MSLWCETTSFLFLYYNIQSKNMVNYYFSQICLTEWVCYFKLISLLYKVNLCFHGKQDIFAVIVFLFINDKHKKLKKVLFFAWIKY